MHSQPMAETDGNFQDEWKPCGDFKCRKCGEARVEYKEWESSCGGYDDTKYRCLACGRTWWVEGADA